jgi:serine/threonine protein kinase
MENKYLKYKMKYLKLKKNIYGGVLTPGKSNPETSNDEAFASMSLHSQSTEPRIIGKGTSGCVYKPPFKCINNDCVNSHGSRTDRCKHGIAKIMEKGYADIEQYKYDMLKLDTIDPAFRYHFQKPHKCKPLLTSDINCPIEIEEHSMLIYDNGNEDLHTILHQITLSNKSPEIITILLKQILRGLLQIVEGIVLFNKNGVCHFDLKSPNIITSISSIDSLDKLNMKLIDFGMSILYDTEHPMTTSNVFNGLNGYESEHIKSIITSFYEYYSLDTLFVCLIKTPEETASEDAAPEDAASKTTEKTDLTYISEIVKAYKQSILKRKLKKQYLLNEFYERNNMADIYKELFLIYKTKSIEDIILHYLQSHDSFQFALILSEICSMTSDPQIRAAAYKFINKSNAIHFNPYKRCKSVDLIHHYNIFLRDIGL